ncbi:peptidoglycan-binding protein [Nocardiopsis mangrovi]|uniref:Peptidoglycan-binding protein n=1 Tax=Nocardiopsis mangrovi TaxID=1179818 RepID=A0ABV9DWH5_9ACTN
MPRRPRSTTSNAALGGGTVTLTGFRYRRRPTLRWGDQGAEVRALQNELLDLGYNLGPAGADGDFGDATYNAVRAFQRARGVYPADGVPGPETRAAMDYGSAAASRRCGCRTWRCRMVRGWGLPRLRRFRFRCGYCWGCRSDQR